MLTGHLQIYLETIFQRPCTQKQKQSREGDYESTQNLQHSIQFEQHRSCQFRTHWKLQTWVQLPSCSGQPAGWCCPQNTHTEHLTHTHPAKSQRCSQPLPHHGCRSWIRAALLHKQVDIVHILLNGQILASTTFMVATKRDSNVD